MDRIKKIVLPNGDREVIEYAVRCGCTIDKIKAILQDTTIDDKECFWRIEEIVKAFEDMGFDAGGRHDF